MSKLLVRMKSPPHAKGRSLRPSRRILLVGLVALLTPAAARIAAPSGASHYRFSAAMVCGIERWNIKTLKDKPRLRRAALTTVAHLVSVPRPSAPELV